MKILNLLRIPFVKWMGIGLILYFGLFANKENPQSLGNRLSKENVKKNLDKAREKSRFIAVNVKMAQEIAKEKEAQKKLYVAENFRPIVDDIEAGSGEQSLSCNDEALISYVIQTKNGKEVESHKPQTLTIGSKKNPLLEQNILGMKNGGIRSLIIPYGLQTEDKKLAEMLRFHATDLKYLVTLLQINKSPELSNSCYLGAQ
jgi:FKBP-type peptidyl-prolyl cis-trans isomerase